MCQRRHAGRDLLECIWEWGWRYRTPLHLMSNRITVKLVWINTMATPDATKWPLQIILTLLLYIIIERGISLHSGICCVVSFGASSVDSITDYIEFYCILLCRADVSFVVCRALKKCSLYFSILPTFLYLQNHPDYMRRYLWKLPSELENNYYSLYWKLLWGDQWRKTNILDLLTVIQRKSRESKTLCKGFLIYLVANQDVSLALVGISPILFP